MGRQQVRLEPLRCTILDNTDSHAAVVSGITRAPLLIPGTNLQPLDLTNRKSIDWFLFMTATKVFISYSWSSSEHEEWVLRFATDLRESGVDAILDKWDLREGHDANAFMEKMVSDPDIKKVVIVSDRVYSEKSDSRKGGAGIEAQIISARE